MAVDKLVDSTQLDADLTSVANAIRAKGGTSGQLAFPAGFVQAIGDISGGGGGENKWVRPSDWPDLDSIDFTNFQGVYLTYDLRVCPEKNRVISLFFTVNNSGTYVVERGTLSNGVFTAVESGSPTNKEYHSTLNPANGDIQLFRITPVNGEITSGGFMGYYIDGILNSGGVQPCVEQYSKHTISFNLNGGYAQAVVATVSYPQHVTVYLQHDKILGTYKSSQFHNDFWSNAESLQVIDLEAEFTALTSFGQIRNCKKIEEFNTSKSSFANAIDINIIFYYSNVPNADFSGLSHGIKWGNRAFEYGWGVNADIIWPAINTTDSDIVLTGTGNVNITSASAHRFALALPTINEAHTVKLGLSQGAFSAEDIAVITEKGWTVI